jgi:hypothetical protein
MFEPPTRALDVVAILASCPHLHGRMPCYPTECSVAPEGENRVHELTLRPPSRSVPLCSRRARPRHYRPSRAPATTPLPTLLATTAAAACTTDSATSPRTLARNARTRSAERAIAMAAMAKLQAATAILGLRRPSAQIGHSTTFPSSRRSRRVPFSSLAAAVEDRHHRRPNRALELP